MTNASWEFCHSWENKCYVPCPGLCSNNFLISFILRWLDIYCKRQETVLCPPCKTSRRGHPLGECHTRGTFVVIVLFWLFSGYSIERSISVEFPRVTIWKLCWLEVKGTQYCPHGLFCLIVRHIVKGISGNKMTSQVDITWYFDRAIQISFLGYNSTTLKACKIVNFKPRLFKLWNRAFLKVNF